MTPEHKASLSNAMRRYFLASVKERSEEPTHRRCARCGETKPVEEFGVRKTKLKSGLLSIRPQSRCRPCEVKRVNEWKQGKIEEGVWAELKKRKEASRDKEKARKYHREWSTARRREEGVEARNWLKPPVHQPRHAKEVPIEPIAHFLEEAFPDAEPVELARKTGVSATRFQRMKKRKSLNIELETADKILCALGCPEQMNILYPLEEEKLVGYQILDPDGILEEQ